MSFARLPWALALFDLAHPMIQMRMVCCPHQHGAGDTKIIVLAGGATIDGAALPPFWLQRLKLRKGTSHHFIVKGRADLPRM
jgi:hypothetical protein